MKFILSDLAREDLDEIHDFIAQDNLERALTFSLELIDQAEKLVEHPYKGIQLEDDVLNERELHYKGYSIVYSIEPDDTLVVTEIYNQAKENTRHKKK